MRLLCALAVLSLASVFAGCSGYDATLPDGGRGRVNCAEIGAKVPVTVLDKSGMPQYNAGVVVTYLATNEEVVLTTDGDGVVIVTDKGPGIVRVQGQFNDLRTQTAEFTFIGGECSSSVTPRAATLQLQ
ncbi:MAG: hypothetical protein AB1938_02385 [Myxococcota bacterium]